MKKINTVAELRQVQMGILDTVAQFCDTHGLVYFLSSGTLLGAVRHGGYIPWDDDIDLYMPRESYDRFLDSFHDDSGTYAVLQPGADKRYYYTFAKVVDTRTTLIEDEVSGYEIGIYIDIFPVDGAPEDMHEREQLFKRKKLLYKIRRCKIADSNPLDSTLAYWCYRLLPVSVAWLDKRIDRLVRAHAGSTVVGNLTEAGPLRAASCFPASCIDGQVDITFEGKMYKTMTGYKQYLELTYGDYMTLPPEDQRVRHHFTAHWNTEQ
ncbi:MAG: LicD family protein [Muribaculaceae bacterium]|nr:LicD family protein [Muribaculaceae bacterium]